MKTALYYGLLLCAGAAAVRGQLLEFSVSAVYPRLSSTPLGSISELSPRDTDTRIKGQAGLGARITWNTPGYYGHEGSYVYNRATLSTILRKVEAGSTVTVERSGRIAIQQASYNFLIYFMPAGERWRPFITGGAQLHQYGRPGFSEWREGGSRTYGVNYGGGLKVKLFNHGLFRMDFREYFVGMPYDLRFADEGRSGGRFRQKEISLGLAVTF